MRNNRILSVALVAAFAVGASGCDDGLAEINENPNAPNDVPAHVLLPEAIQTTVEQFYGQWFNLEFAGLFAQHWAKIQYIEEDLYELRPATVDGWWSTLYAGALTDWQRIIDKAQEPLAVCGTGGVAAPCVNHEATGRTMKVFTGHIMTDIWGDMPWSEALQGAAEEPNTTPSYDSQAEIYDDLFAQLDAALTLFDPDARTWGPEDLIYGGDIEAWMRFANSLKLRLAIRTSDVDPTGAAALIAEVLASPAGLIEENSQNATLAFLSSAPNQNPLFENWQGGRDDHAVSSTLVNMLGELNDPRIHVYAEPPSKDSLALGGYEEVDGVLYRGMTNGTPESDIPSINTISRIGHYWRGPGTQGASTPAYLLTAAEVHFLLAEAVQQGLVPTALGMTAAQLYNEGIRLSMQMWDGADGVEISAADITAYLAQPEVMYDGSLERIIEQKWLALYTNGPEAYAELRRTGFPTEAVARTAHAYDFVPGRVPYADVEQSLNAESLSAAMAAQGISGTDGYQGRVWWDTTEQ